MTNKEAKDCFLIDRDFCDFTQKKLAVVMGMVATLNDDKGTSMEILNEIANIRAFFQREGLREYSNKLKDSIDMDRFIHPEKPVI